MIGLFLLQQRFVLRGGSVLNELSHLNANQTNNIKDQDHGGIQIDIAHISIHPKFNPFTYENDIAIIKFKKSIRPSRNLFPICLPAPKYGKDITDYSGDEVSITGWGCLTEHCR